MGWESFICVGVGRSGVRLVLIGGSTIAKKTASSSATSYFLVQNLSDTRIYFGVDFGTNSYLPHILA